MRCECGRTIEQPKTGRRRTKCDICRPRRIRSDRPVTSLPAAPPSVADPLVGITRKQLEDAGRLESPEGALVMLLVQRLVAPGGTQAGAASLSKAFREALAAAMAGADQDADVIAGIFGQQTG